MKPADAVTQYARDVTDGRVVAGRLVKLACERHLRDLERQDTDEFPYVFDPAKGERVFKFYTYCRHVDGALADQPIVLAPWQKFIIGSIFGWVHRETGLRRFRKAYVQVGRGNGKSTLLSGLGLFMLMQDRLPGQKLPEMGAEVYATATKSEQAHIVYDAARTMAMRSPDLIKRLEPGKTRMDYPERVSKFLPLSKDTKRLDGLKPTLGIIDEYHAHETDEMYGVLVSAMMKRRQPLLFIITTAGFDLSAPCYKDEYTYLVKVLEGTLSNEQYFAYIAQLDKDDNYKDESVWIKANPLVAETEEGMAYLRSELQIALDVPGKMRNFLTKNLNVWVDQKDDGYMPMEKWNACQANSQSQMPDLKGRRCKAGTDLSTKNDLTSVGFEFPLDDGRIAVVQHSFMPAETVAQKRKTDRVPYDLWIQQGWITETPGAVVDYRFIMQYIDDQVSENGWTVEELCYDPFNATQFAQEMTDLGYTCVEIRQGIPTLGEPTKNFRERVLDQKLIHNGDPVLTWAVSNAVTRTDHNQNIMLDKSKATERIDPLAALINAHVRVMTTATDKPKKSVYEKRGFRWF